MASSSGESSPLDLFSSTARGLSLSGLVLIVLFLTIITGSLFPVRLLDPAWQLRIGGALINASPFPLIGLALLQLGAVLDRRDDLLARRRQLASSLAMGVALGYLLLAPLLATASLRQQHLQGLESSGRLRRATSTLEQLRQAVNSAQSVPMLEERMKALQGPKLDAADRLQPLPLLRSRVNSLLDQAGSQVSRAEASAPAANPWRLLPDIARTSVASLALAVGFAGLARRGKAEVSVLQELQDGLARLRLRRRQTRRSRSNTLNDEDYIRQLTDGEE